jgi:hypothetical protein
MADRRHLHQRDLAIFETLLDRRAETLDFLAGAYFGGVRKSALNRLGELRAAGYLQRIKLNVLDAPAPQNIYTLAPKGCTALRLRSLAADRLGGRRDTSLSQRSIPHQIATNRVGDWLGADLIPEALIGRGDRRHRPDAAYAAREPDAQGRGLVFVEVDLGHYSRARVLEKLRSFLAHEGARSILFITPDVDRRAEVARWIREAYGEAVMQRVQPLTLDQVRDGSPPLDPGTEPGRRPVLAPPGRRRDWLAA